MIGFQYFFAGVEKQIFGELPLDDRWILCMYLSRQVSQEIQNWTTPYPFPRRIAIIPFSPIKWAAPTTTR